MSNDHLAEAYVHILDITFKSAPFGRGQCKQQKLCTHSKRESRRKEKGNAWHCTTMQLHSSIAAFIAARD